MSKFEGVVLARTPLGHKIINHISTRIPSSRIQCPYNVARNITNPDEEKINQFDKILIAELASSLYKNPSLHEHIAIAYFPYELLYRCGIAVNGLREECIHIQPNKSIDNDFERVFEKDTCEKLIKYTTVEELKHHFARTTMV